MIIFSLNSKGGNFIYRLIYVYILKPILLYINFILSETNMNP